MSFYDISNVPFQVAAIFISEGHSETTFLTVGELVLPSCLVWPGRLNLVEYWIV